MSFSIGLYRDFARQGGIPFRTVPASHPSDYECKPILDGLFGDVDAQLGGGGATVAVLGRCPLVPPSP